jgi:hypothetical protein
MPRVIVAVPSRVKPPVDASATCPGTTVIAATNRDKAKSDDLNLRQNENRNRLDANSVEIMINQVQLIIEPEPCLTRLWKGLAMGKDFTYPRERP